MLGRGPAAQHRSLREALVAPLLAERLVGYDGGHVPCAVRNISQGGVCLEIQSTYGIPPTFDLIVGDGAPRHGKVMWLTEAKLGARFK